MKNFFQSKQIHLKCTQQVPSQNFNKKTGQIIKLLSSHQSGLSREEIHLYFYEKLHSASITRRESLRMSVEKIIQRSRAKFKPYNLTIVYNKNTKKYYLDTLE